MKCEVFLYFLVPTLCVFLSVLSDKKKTFNSKKQINKNKYILNKTTKKSVKKSIIVAATLAAASLIGLSSCDKGKTKNDAIKMPGGIKYVINQENAKNPLVKTGDFISFNIQVKNSKDSLIANSYESGMPALQEVMTDGKSGSFEDVLLKLHKGDSATVWASSDSIAKKSGRPLPPFIAKGSDIKYTIKIIDIMNKAKAEEFGKVLQEKQKIEQEKKAAAAGAVDEKTIKEYIAKKNLKAENIGNGIYYVRSVEGKGELPTAGDMVKAHYHGTTLDGTVFDSSKDRKEPFDFAVGTSQVIRGWDEGFLKMKKGEKGTLIIPSAMAYGAQSPSPKIKAFSVLVFDVELIDFTKPAPPVAPKDTEMKPVTK